MHGRVAYGPPEEASWSPQSTLVAIVVATANALVNVPARPLGVEPLASVNAMVWVFCKY